MSRGGRGRRTWMYRQWGWCFDYKNGEEINDKPKISVVDHSDKTIQKMERVSILIILLKFEFKYFLHDFFHFLPYCLKTRGRELFLVKIVFFRLSSMEECCSNSRMIEGGAESMIWKQKNPEAASSAWWRWWALPSRTSPPRPVRCARHDEETVMKKWNFARKASWGILTPVRGGKAGRG